MDYVSGSLNAVDAALFEKHLETCAECLEFVAGQNAVWQALDVFEAPAVSANFDRALHQRIAQTSWWDRIAASITSPFRTPSLLRQGLPLMAAAALLTAALVVWERPNPAPAPAPQAATGQLSAEAGAPDADVSLQPEQMERALDDMDMLREFNHLVISEPAAPPKM